MVYDAGWVVADFDWCQWEQGDEGRLLLNNPSAIAEANCEQLAKLITAVFRGDRFSWGLLEEAFERGLLRVITQRAEVLVSMDTPS